MDCKNFVDVINLLSMLSIVLIVLYVRVNQKELDDAKKMKKERQRGKYDQELSKCVFEWDARDLLFQHNHGSYNVFLSKKIKKSQLSKNEKYEISEKGDF